MLRSILFFDVAKTGHHSAFINHVVRYLSDSQLEGDFYIVVHSELEHEFSYIFRDVELNIKIICISKEEQAFVESGNRIFRSFKYLKILNKYVKRLKPNGIVLLDMNIFQFSLLFRKSLIPLKGIIFSQFFWQSKDSLKDCLRFLKRKSLAYLLSKKNNIKNVIYLNDNISSQILNEKWKTDKFKVLPDPVDPVDLGTVFDIRDRFNISGNQKVLLHYGAMNRRKGTIEILKGLDRISSDLLQKVFLIYAGPSVDPDLNSEIQEWLIHLKDKGLNYIRLDYYIDKIMTQSLFLACDYCLIPYQSIDATSGCFALSISTGTPVVGPSKGLLGSLISKFEENVLIENTNAEDLADVFPKIILSESKNKIIDHELLYQFSREKFVQGLLYGW